MADGKTIRYLNVNDKLADKDGRLFEGISKDKLHPGLKGYQIWAGRTEAHSHRNPWPTGEDRSRAAAHG